MADTPPPLRINSIGGASFIPVYEIDISSAAVTRTGPTRVQIAPAGGGGGATTIYAPTGGEYVTYVANNTLSAERILTAGSSVTVVTDGTNIYINALTGGGGTTVYAATGNQYVTISNATDLTDEYVVQASTGISLTSASNILYVHYGSLLVTSTRAINTTYPLAGGGNFSADRTHTVDTAFLVTSARQVLTVYPLSGGGNLSADQTFSVTTGGFLVVSSRTINTTAPLAGGGNFAVDRTFTLDTAAMVTSGRSISTLYPLSGGGDLSANRTFAADTAFLVTSARAISFGSALFAGGGNLGADRTITIGTPIGVGSGGIGSLTLTAQGVLYGSGATAIQATSGLNAGMLVVGSGLGMNLYQLGSGATGQALISTGGSIAGNLAWVNTLGGASGAVYAATGNQYVTLVDATDLTADRILVAGTGLYLTDLGANSNVLLSVSNKTVLIPMALLTVQPDSANAFWMSVTGATVDFGFVRFVDSGEGIATYWTKVPFNVHNTPAWNLRYNSSVAAATAIGSSMVTARVRTIGNGIEVDGAYTVVSSAATYAIFRSNTMTVSAASGGTFDSVVALSGGGILLLEVNRHGGNASDSLSDNWDLWGVDLRVNVI